MSLSCVCDCASCKAGNHVRCYYEQPCRGPQLSDKLNPDSKTLLRLADWIRHAGPNQKGEFPTIDPDTLRRIAADIETAETKFAEAIGMWRGSLEAQAELERELREEPAQLRKIIARQAATIHERQQAWREMKADLEAHRSTCLCDCPHCQWCDKKSILRLPDRPVVPPRG